jgi:hypothetical protein
MPEGIQNRGVRSRKVTQAKQIDSNVTGTCGKQPMERAVTGMEKRCDSSCLCVFATFV